jgi:eukaryotic translation initiation factor 2C
VVVRMEPSLKYPFNVRSFFTDRETKDIGGGIHLWRGYFQSVRPAIGKMIINVDISTGMMYRPGPLVDLCLDFLGGPRNPNRLSPTQGLPDRERLRLQRFLSSVRIVTPHTAGSQARVIKKLTSAGANALSFTMRGSGGTMTVADYFRRHANITLQYPKVICVEVRIPIFLLLRLIDLIKGWIWSTYPSRAVCSSSWPDYA